MAINLTQDTVNILNLHDRSRQEGSPNSVSADLYLGAREFAQRIIRPKDDIVDTETNAFPHDLWAQLGGQGLKGLIVPEEYGGMGQGYLQLAAATMEISRASGSVGLSFLADQALCTHQILKHGTDEQKEKYLAKLASGEFVGALAMSEEGAGSDVMSMGTKAVPTEKDGVKGYSISGKKLWITNAGRETPEGNVNADVLVLYAVTQDKPRKLTAFLVDGDTPGFEAYSKIHKEGMRGSETWELNFQNCFVPEDNIIGQVNKGAHVLMAGLNAERLILGAGALGLAQAALEETIAYTTDRKQFGHPVAHNQAVAHDIADMYSELMASKNHMFSAAAMADFDPKSLTNAVAASVFLKGSKTATNITEQNVYYHGGNGQTVDYRPGRLKRDASLYRVGGGSEAVRLIRIAEEILQGYRAHNTNQKRMNEKFNDAVKIDINSNPDLISLLERHPEIIRQLGKNAQGQVVLDLNFGG